MFVGCGCVVDLVVLPLRVGGFTVCWFKVVSSWYFTFEVGWWLGWLGWCLLVFWFLVFECFGLIWFADY